MEEVDKNKKIKPDIDEPTEDEVNKTKELVKDKYNIVLPKSEALKLARLTKELHWWLKVDEKPTTPRHLTEEAALSLKDLIEMTSGKEITMAEAYNKARGLLVIVPIKEKQRISDEIRAILVTHRKVVRNPIELEKTAKLFRLHYGVSLTDDQLEQVIPYLTKKLWFEEGIDESLEKCLDDLLVYADKRKRGKRISGIKLHDKTRKAFDLIVKELKLTKNEFDLLYREQD